MKGHTGITMTIGKGSVYSSSLKQKLVTRSSTKCEAVGVYDAMLQALWTGYFLKAQSVKVKDTILYQDNTSSILLEKNGKGSSLKRTRHMNIRYFFVKDQVTSHEIHIEHCPTDEMVAGYFTKSLQGKQFYRMRDYILNIDSTSKYHLSHRSVLMNDEKKNDVVNDNDVTRKRTYKEVVIKKMN